MRAIFDYDLLFGRPASPSPSPFWSSEAGGRDFFVVLHTMCACCWLTKSLAATAHAPSTRRHDNSSVFFCWLRVSLLRFLARARGFSSSVRPFVCEKHDLLCQFWSATSLPLRLLFAVIICGATKEKKIIHQESTGRDDSTTSTAASTAYRDKPLHQLANIYTNMRF